MGSAFLTNMAASSAASRPGQIPEAPEEADSSCGASVGSGPWHDPRITPALVELIPQRLYDEGQEMGPISPALYAELVHVGNEADLVVRKNDAYYAEGAFQDVLRGYRVGTNGLDPIVGGLMLRDLARYRRETFGLEGETEESPYTTDSSHTLPEVRALSTLALQRHTSPSPDRVPAVQLNPSILLCLEDVEDSVAVFHRPLGSGASSPFDVPEEVEQLTHLLKVDLYTQDVEGKLEALNGAPLETAYNVSPAEIRRFSDRWKASMVDEFNSLIEKGAIKRVFGEEAARLKRDPSSKVLHTKTVCVAKPGKAGEPFRRKTRIVACGCESEYTDESNLYASGVVADSLRSSLVKAATESWQAHATDIHTAFLLAPLGQAAHQRQYILQPAQVLVDLGIAQEHECWTIDRAIYGLRESPRWWTVFRNQSLLKETIRSLNPEPMGDQPPDASTQEEYDLQQGLVDDNIFKIRRRSDNKHVGLLVLYVDDFLILSDTNVAQAIHAHLQNVLKWECDPLSTATPDRPLRFLGVNIRPLPDDGTSGPGFSLEQEAYIEEVLRGHGFTGPGSRVACSKELLCEAFEENPNQQDIRDAQKATGEALWVSQRSRPDISFVVNYMSSMSTRAPKQVLLVAERLFRYLHQTRNHRLELRATTGSEDLIEVFTDASFAPYGSSSYGGILIRLNGAPCMWRAGRLPLIAVSTAEAELQALSEGAIFGQSFQAALQDITDRPAEIVLRCDSTAAIALAQGSSSQRTRHLKVRAAALYQQLQSSMMRLEHCPGDTQLADLFTKSLPGPRLSELAGLVGLTETRTPESPASSPQANAVASQEANGSEEEPVGISDDTYLYVALLIFIIAVLGVWEGLKATRACCSRQGEDGRPQLRALSKREKLRQAVSEAIEREIPSTVTSPSTPATEGLRRRRSSESSSPPPPPLPVAREYHGIFVPPPPPPIIHVHAPSPAASIAPEPVRGTFREVASGSSSTTSDLEDVSAQQWQRHVH
ncbi:GIP [Symbiodinium natans]|uniref:GIP protein n=1 Tax=Symbiodinium natans TaxID=878477 RepID=A0A812NP91_9DINO|nr:GIP [Symbiodinium natans]